MEKRKQSHGAQADVHVKRMRRLYSQIGEPLPVDVIVDLYRHLDAALDLCKEFRLPPRRIKNGGSRLN